MWLFGLIGNWLDKAFDPSSLLSIVILPAWVLMAIVSLVWCVQFTVKRFWRQAVLAAILPAALILTTVWWGGAYWVLSYPGDVIHFIIQKPTYDLAIAALPSNGHRFMVFDWGGWLFAWEEVIYDETDQVALPQYKAVLANQGYPLDALCGTDRLWGHYYVGHFGC